MCLSNVRANVITRIGVVGCGLMGSGIAEVCARAGLDVVVGEIERGGRRVGPGAVARPSLDRGVPPASSPRTNGTGRRPDLSFTTDLAEIADRQLVVEAVVEDEQAKIEVFSRARQGGRADPTAILASNTSSIPIMKLGDGHAAPRTGHRHPLLQPGAGAAAGGAGHDPADRRRETTERAERVRQGGVATSR